MTARLTDWERFVVADYQKQCARTDRAEAENAQLRQLVKDFCVAVLPLAGDPTRSVLSAMDARTWDHDPGAWQPRARRVLADLSPTEIGQP